MKKKIIFICAGIIAAVAVAISIQVDNSTSSSSLLLANAEAMTRAEGGNVTCKAPWEPVCTTLGNLTIMGTKQ